MNGLKFLTVWFCSVVGKIYVFPITDIPEEDNALHKIQPTALTVLSDPHETLGAMPLHHSAEMDPVLSQLLCVLQLRLRRVVPIRF